MSQISHVGLSLWLCLVLVTLQWLVPQMAAAADAPAGTAPKPLDIAMTYSGTYSVHGIDRTRTCGGAPVSCSTQIGTETDNYTWTMVFSQSLQPTATPANYYTLAYPPLQFKLTISGHAKSTCSGPRCSKPATTNCTLGAGSPDNVQTRNAFGISAPKLRGYELASYSPNDPVSFEYEMPSFDVISTDCPQLNNDGSTANGTAVGALGTPIEFKSKSGQQAEQGVLITTMTDLGAYSGKPYTSRFTAVQPLKLSSSTGGLVTSEVGRTKITASLTARATGGAGGYVALGDSYSAGEGAGSYFPQSATAADRCHRSRKAYSVVAARALGYPSFSGNVGASAPFAACGGAIVMDYNHPFADVPHGPEGGVTGRNLGEPAQAAHLVNQSRSVGLVTLSFGGNNIDFAPILTACVRHGLWRYWTAHGLTALARLLETHGAPPPTCQAVYGAKEEGALPSLMTSLTALYREIRMAAPAAEIVVLGYPNFFPSAIRAACDGVIVPSDVAWGHELMNRFDADIQRTVQQSGVSGILYIPPGPQWSQHDICGSSSWFVKPNLWRQIPMSLLEPSQNPNALQRVTSALIALLRKINEPAVSTTMYFHPTAEGQRQLSIPLLESLGYAPCAKRTGTRTTGSVKELVNGKGVHSNGRIGPVAVCLPS